MAMNDAFVAMADEYVDEGFHPEQIAQAFHLLNNRYRGKASTETGPDGFHHRASHRLFETLKEFAEDDEYNGSWQELSWILMELKDLAQSQARRERKDG
jgi:hypothetical protein